MTETLATILHRQKIEALVRQAETIRMHPSGEDRSREARKLIYAVMFDHALGRLNYAEREQVLETLDFARDFHVPEPPGRADETDPAD
jgi:hypothetical protein